MSDDEARGYLETMAGILASNGQYTLGECALSIADWIGRRQVEGEAGSECNRGDRGIDEEGTELVSGYPETTAICPGGGARQPSPYDEGTSQEGEGEAAPRTDAAAA